MDNRLKVVRGILSSRHGLQASIPLENEPKQAKKSSLLISLLLPAASLCGWHLLPLLCITRVEENCRGHRPFWP